MDKIHNNKAYLTLYVIVFKSNISSLNLIDSSKVPVINNEINLKESTSNENY